MTTTRDRRAGRRPDDIFLVGGGEMGERMRALDWSRTSLGPVDTWPQSLLSPLSMLLPSKAQIILFWGPEFVSFYNDAYRPVFGAKHPQMLGQPGRVAWSEIWESGANLHGLLDGVVNTGVAFHARDMLFLLERYGFVEETYFDVSYDPVRDESGAVGGVFCIVTETTGRVVGERRIKLLHALAARLAAARSVHDACQFALEVLALAPEDAPFAFVHLTSEPDLQQVVVGTPGAEAALAGTPAHLVKDLPFAGGRVVVGLNPQRPYDEQYVSFLQLVSGQIASGIGNARAHEEERRRIEALAALDRAKTDFFSNVSHEFRTPLTLMLGPLEDMISRDEPLSGEVPEIRDALAMVHRNGQRLLKLVNTLLDFARIETGRTQVSFEPVDLAESTAGLASTFRSACSRAGVDLVVDTPPGRADAWVDVELWEKVVLNLMSNAFKFTMRGRIVVRLDDAGQQWRLTVSDTGIGIPREALGHVFERFYRVGGGRGRSHEGSGIGLALVQELVRLHGGTIGVESDVGRGTQFTVELPKGNEHLPADRLRARRDAPPASVRSELYVNEALGWLGESGNGASSLPSPPVDAPRLILADDNADLRGYVQRILSPLYEIEVVTNGADALSAARRRKPDILVTDIMMPGLDGFGLVRELRADHALRDVPVLAMSARAGEEAILEGMDRGFDDYLVKPFGARELVVRVTSLVRLARIRKETEQELREEARTLEILNNVGRMLGAELDLEMTAQAVIDAATELAGAQFGAFFYNIINPDGDSYMLHSLSGAQRGDVERFEPPRNAALFAATFQGDGVVRLDDVTRDPRFGRNPARVWMEGHLPVRSYLAAPMRSRTGEVIGGLFFGHSRPGVFTERAERFVTGVAAQAGIAIDNARLYERSTQLVEQLRELDRRKDIFLATLAHELRNPLAPLQNALHLIRLQPTAGRDAVHGIMERQVDHLVRLVDDLLEMSRITTGALELRREPVDLQAMLRNAIETSQPLVSAAHHRLETSVPGSPLWVDGDPIRLAQILSNLLNNAARYTPDGGTITVSLTHEDPWAVIRVRDTGVGLDPTDLSRIFEMFTRAERNVGHGAGGLGIGLTLAQRLVEMHGGRIEASSAGLGEGSEFTVRLPARSAAPAPTAASIERLPLESHMRILVVDDNRDAAATLAMVLEELGVDVSVVYDGQAALDAVNATMPDAVLLDIGMPGMSGYDVARRILGQHGDHSPVLIALTGWGQEKDRERVRAAGFGHHLVKPVTLHGLGSLLREIEQHQTPRPFGERPVAGAPDKTPQATPPG